MVTVSRIQWSFSTSTILNAPKDFFKERKKNFLFCFKAYKNDMQLDFSSIKGFESSVHMRFRSFHYQSNHLESSFGTACTEILHSSVQLFVTSKTQNIMFSDNRRRNDRGLISWLKSATVVIHGHWQVRCDRQVNENFSADSEFFY